MGRLAFAGRCFSSVINRQLALFHLQSVKQVSAAAQLNNTKRRVSDLQHG